jgi:HEAT repeat protein
MISRKAAKAQRFETEGLRLAAGLAPRSVATATRSHMETDRGASPAAKRNEINRISFTVLREIILLFAMLIVPASASAADAPTTQPATAAIDNPMLVDPLLPAVPHIVDFDARDKTLWLAALARPDAETRRQAADAIGLAASEGMPDLADTAAPLAATLDSDPSPIVRQSCAQALYRLNAWHYAANLMKHDNDDWQAMLIADVALAGWNYEPARAVWRARLSDPEASELAVRSALRAISTGANRTPDDNPPILAIAADPSRPAAERLDAAGALFNLSDANADLAAEKLATSKALIDRLVSATMTGDSHLFTSAQAEQRLLRLADDPEPTVVAIAVRRLLGIDPRSMTPLDGKLVRNEDFVVRMLAVQVLADQQLVDATGLLAKMMDDPNREIREHARDALLSLSKNTELAKAVSDGAAAIVAGSDWRGIEQSLLLLGATGDQSVDDRIVELLSDQRADLRIAAVVAVRRLRIESALPQLADRCAAIQSFLKQQQADGMAGKKPTMTDADFANLGEEGSQIAQALGLLEYKASDAMLRGLVPKMMGFPSNMREAGIWALGRFHAGVSDNGLAGQLLDRATDHSMMMPESPQVQVMAVEALGMMHATSALAPLQKILDTTGAPDPFAVASRWAIAQITGTPMVAAKPVHTTQHGYFLESKN